MRSSNDWRMIIAIIALSAGLVSAGQSVDSGSGIDFFHFWVVPQAVSQWDVKNIYDVNAHEKILQHSQQNEFLSDWIVENRQRYSSGLDPTGTPFFYAVHSWFNIADARTSYLVFQYGSILAFIIAIGLLGRSFGLEPWQWLVFAGLALLLFRPLHSDIGVANVNRFQILQLGLAVWIFARSSTSFRFALAGLVLGTAACYKPNLSFAVLSVGVVLAIDVRISDLLKYVMGLIVSCLTCFILSVQFMGNRWLEWKDYVGNIWDHPFAIENGNYAFSILAPVEQMKIVSGLIMIACVAVLVWRLWRTRSKRSRVQSQMINQPGVLNDRLRIVTAMLVGVLIPLLAGPVAWGHYFVLTLPLGMLLICLPNFSNTQDGAKTDQMLIGCGALGLFLIGLIPVTWFPGLNPVFVLLCLQTGVIVFLAGANMVLNHLASYVAEPNP